MNTALKAKLQQDIYFRVNSILQENLDLAQGEPAKELGIGADGLNCCMKALIENGLVKMKNFATSKNKFGYVKVLTQSEVAKKAIITQRFLQRKLNEYEKLLVDIEALQLDAKQATSFLANESRYPK